jgi:hypothetical protein
MVAQTGHGNNTVADATVADVFESATMHVRCARRMACMAAS